MSYLYVSEQGAVIGFKGNRFEVKYKDGLLKSMPAESMEAIAVFGKVQLSTQCMQECLKQGINVTFYSTNGSYFGRLISTSHVNVQRQRKQAALHQNASFKMQFAKRIIDAKVKNQIVVVRRYARRSDVEAGQRIREMQYMLTKIAAAENTQQLMGYEGTAAKLYFKMLGELIDPAFYFQGRSRRPPLDPFNSMISLGYAIILNEIYGKLEAKGLNPYFGFMHKDREKHPTLASDLMEEWRAVLVDTTALSILNGHELLQSDFDRLDGVPGVFLNKNAFSVYIKKLESKFRTDNKYLAYVDYPVSFRRAMDLQVNQLVKAIETEDASVYQPIILR